MVAVAMIFAFDGYELDTEKRELRRGAAQISVEPQVFSVLQMLIENRERLVGKDEVVEQVWGGRIISDSAIASRIKSARQAIGDDGNAQRRIRTLNRQGFRFVAEVQVAPAQCALPAEAGEADEVPRAEPARPSIAVLPFSLVGVAGPYAGIADALPHDLIVELSRLRWLFVIARGSSFQLRGADAAIDKVKSALNVRYCLSGVVEIAGKAITVTVELCDTHSGGVVWIERYRGQVDAVHEIRAQIAHAVVAALEVQIPLNEARRALNSPSNLDAWSAYHLGLHHMYQFNREGAGRAAGYFTQALELDPGFARAHAGLSFTHHEAAFLHFAPDTLGTAAMARRCAERSLELDPLDPFCNLVMGRALWLSGELEAGLPWLDRAVEINPNYAQGQYSCAWTRAILGMGVQGRDQVDAALRLSPLDPLRYGMLGVRAFSHIALGEVGEAVIWAERAARAPRAHPLIELIAAVAHGLVGDDARAAPWVRSALARESGLTAADFLAAFPFRDPITRGQISRILARLDL
jgi:TolB-like protein